ncbi:MAG: hypothetical protein Kow0067_03770 [Coriobacteriia bacterium]
MLEGFRPLEGRAPRAGGRPLRRAASGVRRRPPPAVVRLDARCFEERRATPDRESAEKPERRRGSGVRDGRFRGRG